MTAADQQTRPGERRTVTAKFRDTVIWILVAGYSVLPFYLVVVVSLTKDEDVVRTATSWFPVHPTLENYPGLFSVFPFGDYLRNSVVITVATTIVGLLVSVPAGYAFARMSFRGRQPLLFSTLLLYMVPPVLLIVPLITIFRQLHLYDTYQGLVVADATLVVPFGIWVLVGFFASIPRELEEAAFVDGATPLRALVHVILPIASPGIISTGILFVVIIWNEFLYGYTFSSSDAIKPIPAAMRAFVFGEAGVFWGKVMAAAVLTCLPVVLVFLVFQRRLIPGLSAGAVKG